MGNDKRDATADATGHDPTVLGVAIAGIVSVLVDEDDWDLFDSMVGLILVLVLLAYGRFRREVVASRWEAAAVGAVWSFCLILIFGLVVDRFQGWFGWPSFAGTDSALAGFWFVAVWLAFTALFAVVLRVAGERLLHDRARVRD